MKSEDRLNAKIIDLETKISFQEDTLEKLNEIVSQHQYLFYEINKKIQQLLDAESSKNNVKESHQETPPPHY